MSTVGDSIDFRAVKQVQQRIWSAGDFATVATRAVIVGEQLCEAVDVTPGERVLDVACGNGNTTLAASRRAWGNTVGIDYVPALLEHGRARAEVERLDVEWVEGDAEELPFDAASFDVVLSSFGAMFAPDQERVAAELLRVCRPGGRIGMANWTPESLVGQFMATVASYGPPQPEGLQPPVLWGTEERLRQLFGDGISGLEIRRAALKFRFLSADHWLEFFRTHFGPVKVVWDGLDDARREELAAELSVRLQAVNLAGDRAIVAPADYLEIVAVRA